MGKTQCQIMLEVFGFTSSIINTILLRKNTSIAKYICDIQHVCDSMQTLRYNAPIHIDNK